MPILTSTFLATSGTAILLLTMFILPSQAGAPTQNNPKRIGLFRQHYINAVRLSSSGKRTEAIAEAEAAIKDNPSFAEAYLLKFELLRQLGRHSEAFKYCEAARRLDPTCDRYWQAVTYCYFDNCDYKHARETALETLKRFPRKREMHILLAQISTIEGNQKKALTEMPLASFESSTPKVQPPETSVSTPSLAHTDPFKFDPRGLPAMPPLNDPKPFSVEFKDWSGRNVTMHIEEINQYLERASAQAVRASQVRKKAEAICDSSLPVRAYGETESEYAARRQSAVLILKNYMKPYISYEARACSLNNEYRRKRGLRPESPEGLASKYY